METLDKKRAKRLYKCEQCQRYYSRKSYYERHVLCCKVLSMSRREAELEVEELNDTPNIRELYILVQELSYKYQKQQAELNSLKRYVEKTKKILNIVDWLNDNCKGSIDFTKWLDSIKVSRMQLEHVFKFDFIQGFMYIIQENLPLQENNLSIRCFDQKKGTFFIYSDSEDWKTMTGIEFERMINSINTKIVQEFKVWQAENREKILAGKFGDNYYQECVIKVLGGNTNQAVLHNKIKSKLYNYLKLNLKRIIQFEFN